jgi:hypothetical protein
MSVCRGYVSLCRYAAMLIYTWKGACVTICDCLGGIYVGMSTCNTLMSWWNLYWYVDMFMCQWKIAQATDNALMSWWNLCRHVDMMVCSWKVA